MNTDEDFLDKQHLEEGPFDNEFVWDGRKMAMRRFAELDVCEGFVDEVDVAEGIDVSEMTLSRMMMETRTSSVIGGCDTFERTQGNTRRQRPWLRTEGNRVGSTVKAPYGWRSRPARGSAGGASGHHTPAGLECRVREIR